MQLDLSQFREARARFDRTYPASAFPTTEEDAYRVDAPVRLSFDLFKDGHQFHLVGRVEATLGLSCGRCLESYALRVDAAFDLLYLPHTTNVGEGEVEVEDDDLTTAFYHEEEIDLGQLVREQFYLALPMKPLCRESCRGLCPECGTNLNTEPCNCVQHWTDPRWKGLRSLLDNGDRKD
ncbi:MAG TPA: DUF177 domain-containing protein [Vicinamibacterales bacterium]|jgi:uncharacterized protein